MHNYRELKIWQRSMNWVEDVYKAVKLFPKVEEYGLSSQLKRCAVSVPSNISEGAGRGSNAQFKFFLEVSMGSSNEAQTHIELARRFNYLSLETANSLMEESDQIYKMILGFYNTLK